MGIEEGEKILSQQNMFSDGKIVPVNIREEMKNAILITLCL